MKKYIGIIMFFSLTLIYTSCEDFLTTESKSAFVEQTVFGNFDFAQSALYGIYAKMHEDQLYGWNLCLYFNFDTDIEYNGGGDDGNKRDLGRYKGTDGNEMSRQTWNALYGAIERANICIDNLGPGSVLWNSEQSKEVQRFYGEALTLRALFYYDLIKYWGDVPWCGESFKAGVPFYQRKTDRDSIYAILIEKDLVEAQKYVPWTSEIKTTKRIGKSYVKGLRARMALTAAGYSLRNKTFEVNHGPKREAYYRIANEECDELMKCGQHRLYPNYETYFKKFHKYDMELEYGETFFELAFGRGYSGNICNHLGMSFRQDDANYGRSSIDIRMTPHMYYSYDRKDIRRNVNVELYHYGSASRPEQQTLTSAGGEVFTHCKWRKCWIVPVMGGVEKSTAQTGVGFPLMRYTDIVLMFAETENELNNGPTPAAKEALKSVRRRAFKEEDWLEKVDAYVESVSGSKNAFLNALINERAWEFCGEMLRKNDLIRWNKLGEKLKFVKDECQKMWDDHPDYQWVPNRIYWRDTPGPGQGETIIEIYNPDFRVTTAPAGTWQSTGWLAGGSAANRTTFKEQVLDRLASGYKPELHNHLFPIHVNIINDSRGYLENDQLPPTDPLSK